MISRRTKEALAAAKARGVKLGTAGDRRRQRDAAAARDAALEPVLRELSHLSTRAAAAEIERRGLGKISYKTVARARVRLGIAGQVDRGNRNRLSKTPRGPVSLCAPRKIIKCCLVQRLYYAARLVEGSWPYRARAAPHPASAAQRHRCVDLGARRV